LKQNNRKKLAAISRQLSAKLNKALYQLFGAGFLIWCAYQ